MTIINFGSLNIDHVYQVEHFVQPGETMASHNYQQFVGGKGLNQSLALARAGATVKHAGNIGKDGELLKQTLAQSGVDVSLINTLTGASGHAVIQVEPQGENCILLHGGANQKMTTAAIDKSLQHAQKGDVVLLQNEINKLPEIINKAAELKLRVVFNPAPMSAEVMTYPLDKVDYLILNQTEAQALTLKQHTQDILIELKLRFNQTKIILTLGEQGVIFQYREQQVAVNAVNCDATDTTAAGDTFIGYFLAELGLGHNIEQCLQTACKAAAICIQQAGAANSIPYRHQL